MALRRTIFTNARPASQLILEDGTVMDGFAFGSTRPMAGEVVFTTGMTSYVESMTDPSYCGQILACTYPLIGNYGVPDVTKRDELGFLTNVEGHKIWVSGMVVSEYSEEYSHATAVRSLEDWMKSEDIPGITGIDTRALTKRIREKGAVLGKIVPVGHDCDWHDPNTRNLIAEVSRDEPSYYSPIGGGDIDIVAVDCGAKENIIRELVNRGANVKVVPWDTDVTKENCDGIFYSNGPGNPNMAGVTVEHLKKAMDGTKPIFGICMGHQLMSLASGAEVEKLKFGNRGQNIPCKNLEDGRCYVTSQNHGFATNVDTLADGWTPLFVNTNDGSNEGIRHKTKPFMCAQFHPEAHGGPLDTMWLFDEFVGQIRAEKNRTENTSVALGNTISSADSIEGCFNKSTNITFPAQPVVPSFPALKKVLVLGSGGLSIGQAGEFDYSGSQAIKALKERGIESVLINPNIATVQTAEGLADSVYLVPVTFPFVKDIIEKEKPDGIFLQFGGQTALNCGIELHDAGVFADHGCRVLGTSVASIIATEDRQIFADTLTEIGERIVESKAVTSINAAVKVANEIGYPVIVRSAFSLGGLGSGFAYDDNELRALTTRSFATTDQVLVEKSIKGWKEVEYEVVRDQYDNCVTVCNMENFDPLGTHTGDSIVIAPSQTLDNEDYHMLRLASMRTARRLGIIGECNVQFALDPDTRDYAIIEVNPRLSRSSALASKATGYPLAWVAAQLAIGEDLSDVKNAVTHTTTACFEPSLDYVVTKIPRWDVSKFENCDPYLGSGMKSVGEVMGIGRSFEEALQKAIRMVDTSNEGYQSRGTWTDDELVHEMKKPTEHRIFAIAEAFNRGWTPKQIFDLTKIDFWWLHKLKHMHKISDTLEKYTIDDCAKALMKEAKQAGFSDKQIADRLGGTTEADVRKRRKNLGIVPYVKQIDTMAAEYPANTNYLYMTYHGTEDDLPFDDQMTMVLGSGVYRIGSSVEFDYSAVQCIRRLRELGKNTIMVNYNPETVSTDFDESDRLYFEDLSLERVLDIADKEQLEGTVVSVGGQIPNNMALDLYENGVKILGTHPYKIDNAEDRQKYSDLMDELGVDQPAWTELASMEQAHQWCDAQGYPILVRPSYVLSGAAMNVVHSKGDLDDFLSEAAAVSKDHPVVVTKFIEGAREIDFDAIAHNGELIVHAVAKHVEQAGVHSGDATLVLPARGLEPEIEERIIAIGQKIAAGLEISGPMNCQFIVSDDGSIKVIETNVRASRSLPFVSKVMNQNFISLATDIWCGKDVKPQPKFREEIDYTAVKVPQFSFSRLLGSDPVLGVEMASTGEVACFGKSEEEAFIKALMASTIRLPKKHILISAGTKKEEFLDSVKELHNCGYTLHGTPGTANFYSEHGVPVQSVQYEVFEHGQASAASRLTNEEYDMLITFPSPATAIDWDKDLTRTAQYQAKVAYSLRRSAIDSNTPIVTNLQVAQLLARSLSNVNELTNDSYQNIVKSN
jgi:carbamoyl-phosphate synthase large subunit/carbamoyl-phosphate synthase small subunit